LKIAINLLFLDKNYVGGISQFTRGLMKGLSRTIPPDATLTFFCNHETIFALEDISDSNKLNIVLIENTNATKSVVKPSRIPYWLKYRLPLQLISSLKFRDLNKRFEAFDVVYVPHGPTAIFPFPRIPTIYSIHDIQHEYYPEFFSKQQLLGRKKTFSMCVKHAGSLQASSKFMKSNFLETYTQLDPEDIFLAPEGVDGEFWKIRDERETIDSFPLAQGESYIFLPAQLWMHKNHITVFRALRKLRDEGLDIHIILTGARFESSQPIFDMINKLEIEDLVHYLGIVSRADLRWLYQHSNAVISAALYESSSLPILEAAANCVPIIAGDTAPNLEMSEKIEMSIAANLDLNSWADAIKRSQLKPSSSHDSNESLKEYDWCEIAELYWIEFNRLSN
jgi:glycosyltransferase involved in cell wall biosynthesis